jgi:hypothetical protein
MTPDPQAPARGERVSKRKLALAVWRVFWYWRCILFGHLRPSYEPPWSYRCVRCGTWWSDA